VAEDGVPEMVFTQPRENEDDASVAQIKLFFYAAMIACSLDVPIRLERVPD
jgi:hypothetical protein